jgi:hypothetical protein
MSSLSQTYWPDPGKPDDPVTGLIQGNRMIRFVKPDGPVFVTPDTCLAIFVFSHEDVEGGFWMRSRLAYLVLLRSTNF